MKKIWGTMAINLILAGCLVFLLFFYNGPQHTEKAADGKKTTETTSAGDPEKIVGNNCTSCHGKNLQGGAGPNLTKIGSKYSQSEIENIINHGKNGMPAGVISAEEAKLVANWLAHKK